MSPAGAQGEFRRGWRIVAASAIGICFGLSPIPIYTTGLFAPYLAGAFGWSMAQIMGGLTVTTLAMLLAGPAVGWLSMRFGVRRVVLTSQLLFGLSFMTLAFSNGSLPLFYATWAVITLAGAGTLPITWTRSVSSWFDRRRGLALGLAMMGSGLFGMLGKPAVAAMLPLLGWRGTYVALGCLPILIGFPVAFALLRDRDGPAADAGPAPGLTFAGTLRQWRFWLLLIAILPISLALGGPVPNLERMLAEAGVSAGMVLRLTPMIGFAALLGRIVGGWLLDLLWAPAVGFVILALPALSCWLLATGGLSDGGAVLATFLIGFALGIEYDLMAFLVARYFGLRAYGATYALLYVSFSLGAGFGPMLMGYDHDLHGSFRASLVAASWLLVASAMSLLLLGRYRYSPHA